MTSPTVRVEKLDRIHVVTLDRPDVRNAVDAPTAIALYDAFRAFEADEQARVAVFHGAHGHFCAGWDLQYGARQLQAGRTAGKVMEELEYGEGQPSGPMGPTRLFLSKPVIAAVSGAAVAGGMELALWCDMRVLEQDAYFGVYCRRFGVPLIDGGTVRLPRIVGMGRAMDLILTGRKVEAGEALHMGLANRVVRNGDARTAAITLAEQLAAFPQKTMLSDRASAYAQWDLSYEEALRQEWARSKECLAEGLQGAARFTAGEGRHGKF